MLSLCWVGCSHHVYFHEQYELVWIPEKPGTKQFDFDSLPVRSEVATPSEGDKWGVYNSKYEQKYER